MTKNAVLASEAHGVKASLRSDFMLPNVAIIDPLLTVSNPRDVTVRCGNAPVRACVCTRGRAIVSALL